MNDYLYYGEDCLFAPNYYAGGTPIIVAFQATGGRGWIHKVHPKEFIGFNYADILHVDNTRNQYQQFVTHTGDMIIHSQGFEVVTVS